MERAVQNLSNFDDNLLFEAVAEGVNLILANVNHLDSAAHHLSAGNHRDVARILGELAAEEAAKVLILLDAIRCPPEYADKRKRTLGWFYSHFAKRLYADVCDWGVTTLQQLMDGIDQQSDKYYLGGPNDVDWIMRNWIISERERMLYVDYVRYFEVGKEKPISRWLAPFDHSNLPYFSREIVRLAAALGRLGVTVPTGLAIISDIWRSWKPEPDTTRNDLRNKTRETTEALREQGIDTESTEHDISLVRESWSFPLWSAELRERRNRVDDLREIQEKWRDRDAPCW